MKILLLLIPFLLVSCFQEEKIYTVNPDGSGKVEFKATFPLDSAFNIKLGDESTPSPEKKAKEAVAKIFEKSEGVSAWADVTYKINDEGKIEFQGTAYFSDLNKLELKMGSIDSDTLKPTLTKKNGLVTVECALAKKNKNKADAGKKNPKWAELTKEQQKKALAKTRQELMQLKAVLAGIAGDMSSKVIVHLPGPAKKATGFKQLSSSSYTITQTGETMLKGIDKLLADEKMMEMMAAEGDMKQDPPAEVSRLLFGYSSNPAVSFSASSSPAFDYKKELKAAQKAAPAMMEKLGLTVAPAAPMMGKATFKSLRLAGLRIVTPFIDRDVRPFSWSAGTSISLIGELPGAVVSAEGGKIETFVLNNGQNLLSSKSWDKKPKSIKLSDDGTLMGFEVQSNLVPDPDATAIKMLKGEIVCTAAGSTKVINLAFAKMKKGETSQHYGAKITEIKTSKYNEGKKEISIHFELKKDLIKQVKFFDKDGTELKSKRNGHSWSGDSGSFTFLCDDALAEDGVVKLEIYADLKRHVLPFLIENTPLLPRKSTSK